MKTGMFLLILMALFVNSEVFAASYGGGKGTAANPYQIWTPVQMNAIGTNQGDWNKCFKLMADINMSAYTGTQYNIIGNATTQFTGQFDGNNHKILNLTYSSAGKDYVGLFGWTLGAEIKNLGVEDVNITARDSVGAIVGVNEGTMTACYMSGHVRGTTDIGGLAGWNEGTLNKCYANGSVSGTDYFVGGIAGFNRGGTIASCYANGTVTGDSFVGGLIGNNNYGGITACFWDNQTTGASYGVGNVNPDPTGAAGKTTAQMKTLSTFTDASWDFSFIDGDSADWQLPNGDYPRLIWEIIQAPSSPTNVSAAENEFSEKITITWTASFQAAAYDVYRNTSDNSAGSVKINPSDITVTSYDDTSTVVGTTYWYWVKAKNVIGYSDFSAGDSAIKGPPKFGTISGKTNKKLTVSDSCDTPVTFSLTGGGYGEIAVDANDKITLYNTGNKSILTISTPKGKTANIKNITVNNSLKGIMAKTTNLGGSIAITGSLGTLTIKNAQGSISIGPSSVAATMVFNVVNDLDIDSQMPIKSITASDWIGGSINAPSIASITSKNDLDVNDVNVDETIGTIKVADSLSGSWQCKSIKSITTLDMNDAEFVLTQAPVGRTLALGTLTVKGYTDWSRILSTGNIGTVTFGVMENSVCFAGVIKTRDVNDANQADGVLDLPNPSADINYSMPAAINSIKINGIKGEAYGFQNSSIAAAKIINGYIANPDYTNDGKSFGLAADYIKSLTIKDTNGTYSWKELKVPSDVTVSLSDVKILLN
jgi:hypothetical protein